MKIAKESTDYLSVKERLDVLELSESSFYRWLKREPKEQEMKSKLRNSRRLLPEEEDSVLRLLCSKRFVDMAPEAIVATLLDEEVYHCSARTMYRILNRNRAVQERRNQRRHPEYKKPELLATGPNQLWTWDITKLRTGKKWTYHYLYVIMDVYSRYVVGWLIAPKENALLAEQLIMETCSRQGIGRDELTIHADRGSAMTSKTVSQLMADLGVTRSHSRPHVSNDNPFSESQFKTLKYHSNFPKAFETQIEAKEFLEEWFIWYNTAHRHSGIKMLTPETVHMGHQNDVLSKRQEVLLRAFSKNPNRFPGGKPKVAALPAEVWINKPISEAA